MSKEQTAVDYLYSELKRIVPDLEVTPTQGIELAEAIIKAKELHKEQIIDAYANGAIDFQLKNIEFTNGDDIEYYNDKYN